MTQYNHLLKGHPAGSGKRKYQQMTQLRHWWKVDTTGQKSHMIGVRVTEQESERLEELRQLLRLRSSSEVVRFALQVVECICIGNQVAAESADEVVAKVESCLHEAE